MRASKFPGNPNEGRSDTSECDTAARNSINGPGESAGQKPPSHGNQKQHAPTYNTRYAAVHGKHFRDPRNRSENKGDGVKKSAEERDARCRSKDHHQQQTDADPRVHREI